MRRRAGARLLTVLPALAALAAPAACSSSAGAPLGTFTADPHALVLIGDSVFQQSSAEIADVLHPQAFDADPGRSAYEPGFSTPESGWAAAQRLVPTVPAHGWLVMEIGTNDIHGHTGVDRFRTFVHDVVALLPDDRCLAWVMPYVGGQPIDANVIAIVIEQEVHAQPCRALVRWDEVARPLVVADGIHPTVPGRRQLACLVAATVRAEPGC